MKIWSGLRSFRLDKILPLPPEMKIWLGLKALSLRWAKYPHTPENENLVRTFRLGKIPPLPPLPKMTHVEGTGV